MERHGQPVPGVGPVADPFCFLAAHLADPALPGLVRREDARGVRWEQPRPDEPDEPAAAPPPTSSSLHHRGWASAGGL